MVSFMDKINVNGLIKSELWLFCRLCMDRILTEYPDAIREGDVRLVSKSDAPQYHRWWLVTNFPNEFFVGRMETGSKGGNIRHRGISSIRHN